MRLTTLLFLCACSPVSSAAVEVANGGFDQIGADGSAPGWRMPRRHYKAAYDVGMNGSGGLLFENRDDREIIARVTQPIRLRAGRSYRVSAWFQTEDVVICKPGPGRWGVCVGLVWRDSKGKKLGETWTYPAQGKGFSDWRIISALTPKIPDGVASSELFISCLNQSFGRAAIDKVHVEEIVPRPVEAVYTSAYRDTFADDDGELTFYGALDFDEKLCALSDAAVEFSFTAPGGRRRSVKGNVRGFDASDVTLPSSAFACGSNEVTCVLRDRGGRELGRASRKFMRMRERPRRKVWFDRFNRCIVDGKPFFPIGCFDTDSLFGKRRFLDRFAEGSFNSLMCYRPLSLGQMKALEERGIKVIYDLRKNYTAEEGVKDGGAAWASGIVAKFKDCPNLLAWYINDERPLSQVPLMEARRSLLMRLDPDHPTWSVQDVPSTVGKYMDAFDVFGCDPYPVSRKPLSMMTDYMTLQRRRTFRSRPIWQVPQAFSWGYIERLRDIERRPTEKEMRNMALQAIAGGANGVVFFSLHAIFIKEEYADRTPLQLWEELKRISRELSAKTGVFLADPGPEVVSVSPGAVARTWRYGGRVHVLIVNTSTRKNDGVIVLADGNRGKFSLDAMEHSWMEL